MASSAGGADDARGCGGDSSGGAEDTRGCGDDSSGGAEDTRGGGGDSSGGAEDTSGGGDDVTNHAKTRVHRGRNYIRNSSLGLKRAPNAFAFFKQSMSGALKRYDKRRINQKTSIFRFDLLALKFKSMSPRSKQVFQDRAREAAALIAEQRSVAIARRGGSSELADARHVEASVLADARSGHVSIVLGCSDGGQDQLPSAVSPAATDVASSHELRDASLSSRVPQRTVWTDVTSGTQRTFEVDQTAMLGSGSFGACFRATETATGWHVCAKFAVALLGDSTPADAGGNDVEHEIASARGHLRREMSAMEHLSHPNIARAIGLAFADDGSLLALLMPLWPGTLKSWVLAQEPAAVASTVVENLRWRERAMVFHIASGLSHTHSRNMCPLRHQAREHFG